MAWPLVLIALAGAALKVKSERDARKRQEKLRQSMEQYERGNAAQGRAVIEQHMQEITPERRQAALQSAIDERREAATSTVASLDRPAPGGENLHAPPPSSDYGRAQEAAAGRVAESTRRAIEQFATAGAPGEAQQRQSLLFGRAASEVDSLNTARGRVRRRYLDDIDRTVPNRRQQLAGNLLLGTAGAMGGIV